MALPGSIAWPGIFKYISSGQGTDCVAISGDASQICCEARLPCMYRTIPACGSSHTAGLVYNSVQWRSVDEVQRGVQLFISTVECMQLCCKFLSLSGLDDVGHATSHMRLVQIWLHSIGSRLVSSASGKVSEDQKVCSTWE